METTVYSDRERSGRGTFIKGATAAGISAVLAGVSAKLTLGASAAGTCTDTAPRILATLLITERLATTFYYTGLTSPGVMSNSRLGGSSSPRATSTDPLQHRGR